MKSTKWMLAVVALTALNSDPGNCRPPERQGALRRLHSRLYEHEPDLQPLLPNRASSLTEIYYGVTSKWNQPGSNPRDWWWKAFHAWAKTCPALSRTSP